MRSSCLARCNDQLQIVNDTPLQVNLQRNVLKATGPKKQLAGGVTAIAYINGTQAVVIGTGKGVLGLVHCPPEVRCFSRLHATRRLPLHLCLVSFRI